MSYIRIKINSKHDFEYFDNAKDFAKRYRELEAKKINIDSIGKIECHFVQEMNDYGIRQLLLEGEPLNTGYLLKIKEKKSDTYLYHDGQYLTRNRLRARVFTEKSANQHINKSRLQYQKEFVENFNS